MNMQALFEKYRFAFFATVLLAGMFMVETALAISVTGNFGQDDDVQLIHFTVSDSTNYVLETFGYAGGFMSDGTIIPDGGFDPILSLFDTAGILITSNDDGMTGRSDPNTGQSWDSRIITPLSVGDYTLVITQYDNEALGPTLADGFIRQGEGNYTPILANDEFEGMCLASAFCDVSDTSPFNERTSFWAIDITTVPVPATIWLFSSGLLGLIGIARREKSA
jgi:hypothetical protein